MLVSSLTVIVIVSLFTSNQFQAKYYDIDLYCFFFSLFFGYKGQEIPPFRIHKFKYKFRFLDDDCEKLFALVRVNKVQHQLDSMLQF